MPNGSDVTRHTDALAGRLAASNGRYYIPGLQMLLRMLLDQLRMDHATGLRTRGFVTGYPGSPLAGFDLLLNSHEHLLHEAGIIHAPARNEESAATALMGTQMLDKFAHPDCDGVVGVWYGKGPGIDRSGDALKHGNFAGTSKAGAVVVLSGEDHRASSSTVPFQEEFAFASAGIPVLYPASISEFYTMGLHAVAMSRVSGSWVALKLVTDLCDSGELVEFPVSGQDSATPTSATAPMGFHKRTDFTFFPGRTLDIERHLYRERHGAVVAYARANQVDREIGRGMRDRIGIVSSGKSYADIRQVLSSCGLDIEGLGSSPLRILKIGLVYPVDPDAIRKFARGLRRVIVIEEKRDFLETQVKAALVNERTAPVVVGKMDEDGTTLLPVEGGLSPDILMEALSPYLQQCGVDERVRASRLGNIRQVKARVYPALMKRSPNYCSGCPHSVSTRLPEGAVAWGGPGCACFGIVIEQPRWHVEALTQYGGEGLPWIGLSPFTSREHIVQNIGDGSLWHSSYSNIRACVSANVNITFKVLFNGYVANTGGQVAVGAHNVAGLVGLLAVDGVRQIAIVTKTPRAYRELRRGKHISVHRSDEILDVQRRLAEIPGVTVLIYDETCANERRRQEKRGLVEKRDRHVVINHRVCENCGDCGRVSNCMSLRKVDTAYGPKTAIERSSCNQDFACVEGDCPAFVSVQVAAGTGYRVPMPSPVSETQLPGAAVPALGTGTFKIIAPGVGGTGVITTNALLAVGAQLDGLEVRTYDQTGAAQKGGPVLSTLVVAAKGTGISGNVIGAGEADLCLALDLVAATSPAILDCCSPSRTVAVVNETLVPTGEMVRDASLSVDAVALAGVLGRYCSPTRIGGVPAGRIAQDLFGDHMVANLVAVGAAYQAGVIPISAASLETAISLNGVNPATNVQAFRYGRLWVADKVQVLALLDGSANSGESELGPVVARFGRRQRAAYERLASLVSSVKGEDGARVRVRIADLIEYQSVRYAERFARFVSETSQCAATRGAPEIPSAVSENLYKLMAYKDEYEVARLYLLPDWRRSIAERFDAPQRIWYHLHPPFLRAFGKGRKTAFGGWFVVTFYLLRAMRVLRGSGLDPFGHTSVRQTERELIGWYRGLVMQCLRVVNDENKGIVLELLRLPEMVRGFEAVKMTSVERMHQEEERLLAEMRPSLARSGASVGTG